MMLSLVDACLGRLPGQAAPCCRAPLLRLLSPLRPHCMHSLQCRAPVPATAAAAAGGFRPAHARAVATAAAPAAAEDFFATNAVTFGGLGLSAEVCGALQHAGYPRPAHSQVGRQRERQWAGGGVAWQQADHCIWQLLLS